MHPSHSENIGVASGSHESAGPTASLDALRLRARFLAEIRSFFAERGYWEVETPILSADTVVDLHIDPMPLHFPAGAVLPEAVTLFLQTSPEFAMKRLLAAGSGSIYQIAHAFRQTERSSRHNPEFTLVEWYRVDGHYHELMREVGALVSRLLGTPEPAYATYRELFLQRTEIDPFLGSDRDLATLAAAHGFADGDRDSLLNFLLAALVEPTLGLGRPTFVYDYPASQAALAEIDPGPPPVARRFELYIDGTEICNGYQELTKGDELRERNECSNQKRRALGKPTLPCDSRLLLAMDQGLPHCAGVALGLDRLLMLAVKSKSIDDVIAFPIERA